MGVQPRQSSLDKQLGLWSWDEHIGTYVKLHAVELPMTEDVRQGDSFRQPPQGILQRGFLSWAQRGFWMSDHPGARLLQHVCQDELGFKTRDMSQLGEWHGRSPRNTRNTRNIKDGS